MACPACRGTFLAPPMAAPVRPVARPIAPTSAGSKPPQPMPDPAQTPASGGDFSLSGLAGQFGEMIQSATATAKQKAPSKPAPNENLLITLGAVIGGGLFLAIIAVAINSKPTGTTNESASERRAEKHGDAKATKATSASRDADGDGGFFHAHGELGGFTELPPPIKEAQGKGRNIWCLLDYQHFGRFEDTPERSVYAVFDGNSA